MNPPALILIASGNNKVFPKIKSLELPFGENQTFKLLDEGDETFATSNSIRLHQLHQRDEKKGWRRNVGWSLLSLQPFYNENEIINEFRDFYFLGVLSFGFTHFLSVSIPDSFIILKIPVFTSSHYEDNLCLGSSGTMCNCAREDIFVDFVVDFNVIKLLFGAGVF